MFSKYVNYEVTARATFNYWEPSFPIDKDGRRFTVYHTKYPVRPEPNLVVIEANDDPEELYFRTFLGKHSGECETEEQAQPFFEEVKKTIDPKFRIKGKDLEKRILNFVMEIDKKSPQIIHKNPPPTAQCWLKLFV